MLNQRLASNKTASSSQCARPIARGSRQLTARRKCDRVRRAAAPEDLNSALDELLSNADAPLSEGNPAFSSFKLRHNSRPDFSNPNWTAEVDDWAEFWSSSAWDERELEDLYALDDEHDAALMLGEEGGEDEAAMAAFPGPRGAEARLRRAQALINALGDIDKQAEAVRILGNVFTKETLYHNASEQSPDTVGGWVGGWRMVMGGQTVAAARWVRPQCGMLWLGSACWSGFLVRRRRGVYSVPHVFGQVCLCACSSAGFPCRCT